MFRMWIPFDKSNRQNRVQLLSTLRIKDGGNGMSDLIDRGSVIDELNKLDVSDGVGISSIACSVQESAINAIHHLPSVEKTGKWIKENRVLTSNPPQYVWHCSECGTSIYGFSSGILTPYCHQCGAKMEVYE